MERTFQHAHIFTDLIMFQLIILFLLSLFEKKRRKITEMLVRISATVARKTRSLARIQCTALTAGFSRMETTSRRSSAVKLSASLETTSHSPPSCASVVVDLTVGNIFSNQNFGLHWFRDGCDALNNHQQAAQPNKIAASLLKITENLIIACNNENFPT